jgi:kynurenine formamidase
VNGSSNRPGSEPDRRVSFDFEIEFSNGGGIQGQGFRLDLHTPDISDRELADYIVQDLRLLMVKEVRILNKRILLERHKRSNAPAGAPTAAIGKQFIDLSHTIMEGMVTYKGLPAPLICDYLTREASQQIYAEGTSFQISKIEMVSNTGTYIDSPFHRFEDGADLAELPLDSLAEMDAVVVRATGSQSRVIDWHAFAATGIRGKAVLVHTDWAQHWGTEQYFDAHPYLTATAAAYLKDKGARLVGIDSLNVDDTADGTRPVHTILLGAGIPIVEHLRGLDQLPIANFTFSAVPPKVKGVGTFPVRAYATLPPHPANPVAT